MTTQPWTPKVGDPVRYVAKSSMTGRLVNVRGERIAKITPAGYISVTGPGVSLTKFKVGEGKPLAHEVRLKKFGGSMIPCHLEPVSEAEWEKLPHDNVAGQAYARELERAAKADA